MTEASAEQQQTPPEGEQKAAPPWGSDDEFKPELAWERIQKQSKDIAALKAKALTPDAARKLAEYDRLEQASKSDLERAQQAAAELERRAVAAERAALVNEIALTKGLPASLARRLQGDDRESLEADADELLTQFPTQQEPAVRAPRTDPSQGSSARGGAASTPADEFANFIKRQRV